MNNISKKIMAIVLTTAIFSYLVYIYFVQPTEGGIHIQCISRLLLHANCFSCGMTRFVYFAMHGDFAAAFQYNFFGPLILLVLAVIYFYFIRWAFANKPFPNVPMWIIWVFLSFVLVYSVLRNLPIDALAFLAPPS